MGKSKSRKYKLVEAVTKEIIIIIKTMWTKGDF